MSNWIRSKSHAAGCVFLFVVSVAGLVMNGLAMRDGKEVNMLYMASMALLAVVSLLWVVDFYRKARKGEDSKENE